MLSARAEREGAPVTVRQQDLFDPTPDLVQAYDVVYSLGVVEHFADLPAVVRAKARYLAPGGVMFSMVPNMAGMIGRLTRRYNRKVYDLHVVHDLESLTRGHRDAGLEIRQTGYLCSTNFGVLSSCFVEQQGPGWTTYRWLSRLSKLLWMLESRVGDLPRSRTFSPYLYVVSSAAR
jgi:hypothetical protein